MRSADAAIILKQLSASLQRADTFTSITWLLEAELESARQVFAILIEGIWFAQDSPLEGPGFELSVPRPR
jgi:hypothetical protein